jgi:hypothetical protein
MKLRKSDLELETIVNRISRGELDLQPDFQRGEVWDAKRRQRLIDTILRDWYVPAIHIVVNEDGKEVVLDGQQRLVAIREFFADKLKIDGAIEPHDEAINALHGLKYSNLPPNVRLAVNRFVLPVTTLTRFNPQEPNELFFRLNQAYNLTPPEKRNALHGEARNQVRNLVSHFTQIGLLSRESVGFSNGRLAYDDVVARACVAVETADLRRHINNNVVEDYYRTQEFSQETIASLKGSGQILFEQLNRVETRIRFNKGTLQSWLVYCAWAPALTGNVPEDLLANFEQARLALKAPESDAGDLPNWLLDLIRVYEDRASYRVTDVSSVRARDLVIHVFSHTTFRTPARRNTETLVPTLEKSGGANTSRRLFEFIDASDWGADFMNTGNVA